MRILSFALSTLLIAMPISLNAQDMPDGSQTTDQVFIPSLLQQNPNASIFYSALVATHLRDTLEQYLDASYPPVDYEWTRQAFLDNSALIHRHETPYETGDNADRIAIPEKREFKYTLFVVPDNTLAEYSDSYWSGGIHNLNELRQYAEKVYPEGKGLPDESRSSSLNKLISYHILPCWLSYDQFNTSQKEILQRRLYLTEFDVEDFFETLLPHSVMRISTAFITNERPLGIFINRKGAETTGLIAEGIRIAQDASEYNLPDNLTNICINGGYHYVNKLLVYDEFTRETALQTRMRIMACTLSPDFINSGGRGRLSGTSNNRNIDKMVMTYQSGYCRNFSWRGDMHLFVRYRDKSFGTYYGDELSLANDFDITFRLPAVSKDGLYEIRIWNNGLSGLDWNFRGNVLFYFGKDADNLVPCNTPVDMSIILSNPAVGAIKDNEFNYLTEKERQEAIYENDKAIHQRGYMKAPDSYTNSSSTDYSGDPIRGDMACYRKIICETYMKADQDYYLRLRQLNTDDRCTFAFSFIEIVPYSVYSGENGPEDKH